MWTIVSNPISTHLLAAFLGAAGAWWATHKTAVKAAETAVATATTAVVGLVNTATTQVKKDI